MKKFVLVSLVTVLASQAHASKARIQSLQGAEFLKDSQTIFQNPAHVNSLGQYMTVEFGGSTTTSAPGAPKAEGGIFAKEFGANVGIYLGHENTEQNMLRRALEKVNNPVEVFYAKDNWGASVSVSNHEDKNTDTKEQSLTLRYGVDNGSSEYYGSLDLIANSETVNNEYTGGPLLNLGYEKAEGSNYYFGKFKWGAAEQETPGVKSDIDVLGLTVGALSRKIQNVYYGVSLEYVEYKFGKAKDSALLLPVVIGIEADVNTWATLRASITQSILLGQEEKESVPSKKIINKNDTTVAAGVALKYNKFVLDGVISASRNGNVNGNDVLSSAALTYNF